MEDCRGVKYGKVMAQTGLRRPYPEIYPSVKFKTSPGEPMTRIGIIVGAYNYDCSGVIIQEENGNINEEFYVPEEWIIRLKAN